MFLGGFPSTIDGEVVILNIGSALVVTGKGGHVLLELLFMAS
jgi:hypothetical protein